MYFCKLCNKYFSKEKRSKSENIWETYAKKKQTQQEIADLVGKSRKWINESLQKEGCLSRKNSKVIPQKIVLVIDTTYFKQFGLMVFRSANLKKNLLWKIVDHETNYEYFLGIQELINDGWAILGIVADGKPGLGNLFPEIPFQKCQFHQFQSVTQCISKNPKLQASQELRQIMFYLKETDQVSFEYFLDQWYEVWQDFLKEKTTNIFTGKKQYTHQRLRRAYFGLRRNLEVLFTFQYHSKELQIPNTTNSLDGYFSHLKSKLSVHRGASKETQINLISQLIFL